MTCQNLSVGNCFEPPYSIVRVPGVLFRNVNEMQYYYRRFHGRGRHLGSGANAAKFTVNVWEKS